MKWIISEKAGGATLRAILLAGFCGGMAEIIWVQLYAMLTAHNSAAVARQVTASLLPGAADAAVAPALGIAIHLMLSLLLAMMYAKLVWVPFARRHRLAVAATVAAVALTAVWAVNFLVILPVVNAKFVSLLPYPVSLGSKIMFGLAMTGILWGMDHRRRGEPRGAGRRGHAGYVS